MRLGEIKKIIEEVLGEDNKININHEPVYGGQAQNVNNFVELKSALEILNDQSWNNADSGQIQTILDKYDVIGNPVQLSQEEFNQFNSYVSSLNTNIPLYVGILNTMVEEQNEYCINIKLPDNEYTLAKLETLNKRLNKILKKFNFDGEFVFKGFDIGTSWYVLCANGFLTYNFFIACLKIAQEYYKTKEEYYKSKKAELDYKASLENTNKDFSKEGLEKYTVKRLELIIEEKVQEAIAEINNTKGKTKEETHTQLIIATKDLVKELDDGVEFHLSLNPPVYTNEINGELKLDYIKLKEIKSKNTKPKSLKSPADSGNVSADDVSEDAK